MTRILSKLNCRFLLRAEAAHVTMNTIESSEENATVNETGFRPADILIPKNVEMQKWSVVACDQYTSEPDYWAEVEQIVGDAPSTLRLTLPEAYLGAEDPGERIARVNETMRQYRAQGLFETYRNRYFYVERTLADGKVRHGLIGMIDLEAYDYHKGSESLVRATEGTVLDRIPPRVRIRKDAPLEFPHVMLLIDDKAKTVIEPLAGQVDSFEPVYHFPLMMQSGSIRGFALDDGAASRVDEALSDLADPQAFSERYGVSGKGPLLFAVGDGNHSLASAKESYELRKQSIPESAWATDPARWALVEVVNLHDASLAFEPIHRVVFDIDPEDLLRELGAFYRLSGSTEGQTIEYISAAGSGRVTIENPRSNLAVGSLQIFLDGYVKKHGGRIDYIHGDEVTRELGAKRGNIGFLLPAMDKSELFPTVILDGALPRKTFSMGHACDKRFYLEGRTIRAE